jgi:hypothetical protein
LLLSVGPPAVSIHFLHTGCAYWNEIWYTDLSKEYLGQFLFLVQSSNFWQSYAPWASKNSNNLHFPFILFSLVACIEMKFGIQIYYKNMYVKFCFGYNRAIFDSVMPLELRKIPIICSLFIFFALVAHIEMKFGIQIDLSGQK